MGANVCSHTDALGSLVANGPAVKEDRDPIEPESGNAFASKFESVPLTGRSESILFFIERQI